MTQSNILTKKRLWFGLILLLIILLIARIPAIWAAYAFTQAAPGLRMSEINGTLWTGRSGSTQIILGGDLYSLGELSWSLHPTSLLTLTPCADIKVSFQNQNAAGLACVSSSGAVTLSDFEANFPAGLTNLFSPTQLAGNFSVIISEGDFDGEHVKAIDGSVSWREGAFHDGEKWLRVGSFGARLSGDGQQGINIDLQDLGGPVLVDLDANYNPTLRPNDDVGILFTGEVGVRDSAHPDLATILPTMAASVGEPSDNGYRISWSF
ncbi:type II secretion system protein N [Sessilibacter sp. MAH2]